MKTIKTYEDFVNEEINWRKALIGATIVTGLSLSSCDTKTELENKKPQIENLIINDINDLNKRIPEEMAIEFNEIDSLKGPIQAENYFIDTDSSKVMMGIFVDVYFIICKVYIEEKRYWFLTTYLETNKTSASYPSIENQFVHDAPYENYSDAIDESENKIKRIKDIGIDLKSTGPAVTKWKTKNNL